MRAEFSVSIAKFVFPYYYVLILELTVYEHVQVMYVSLRLSATATPIDRDLHL